MSDLELIMEEMSREARLEVLKLAAVAFVVLTIICIVLVIQFNKALWIAKIKEQDKKRKTLKIVQISTVSVLVAAYCIMLFAVRGYKQPFYITKGIDAYNEEFCNVVVGGRKEAVSYAEHSRLDAELVARKYLFAAKEGKHIIFMGFACVDGTEYTVSGGDVAGERDLCTLSLHRVGGGQKVWELSDIFIKCDKGMQKFEYMIRDAAADTYAYYIGPAASREEAQGLIDSGWK